MIADALILVGSFFILAAAIGVTRFPDLYTRLHASTKLVTLGGLGVFLGTALALADPFVTTRMLLITAFFFLTAPLSAYMIARAAYLRGLSVFREEGSADEWGAFGAETGGPEAGGAEAGDKEAGDKEQAGEELERT